LDQIEKGVEDLRNITLRANRVREGEGGRAGREGGTSITFVVLTA